MATEPTGATAPLHAPFARAQFFGIRLTRDPEESFAAVCRILADHRARPDHALELCSAWIGGHGVESVALADDSELLYVNVGDTYDATLCYAPGRGFFVSSWGDVYEVADREREERDGERRCAYCSEWAEPGEPCGSCGRDPETGDPMPEQLRHVRLETGHTLRTWDTGRTRGTSRCGRPEFDGAFARALLGYELRDPNGAVLFHGADYGPAPHVAIDSDDALRGLLGFLTLRPGDTDADYFADYSDRQWEFAESSDCELLQFLYSDDGDGQFVDVDDDDAPTDIRCRACGRPAESGDCGCCDDDGRAGR